MKKPPPPCPHPDGFVQMHNPNTWACLKCGKLRTQLVLPLGGIR